MLRGLRRSIPVIPLFYGFPGYGGIPTLKVLAASESRAESG
jgi:hypothetical protein